MMMMRIAVGMVVLCLIVSAVGQVTLNGAGSTFVYPMMSKWAGEYHRLHPDVQINYQSIGSGGSIRQVIAGTVDFGATDGPMTDEQLSQAKGKVFHIPVVLGSDVPTYHLPSISTELKFTPQVLAGIFLGKITNWNDKAIATANPGVNLPNQQIIVVHRSDGSGTTYVWTDYLSKVSPEWLAKVGKGTSVAWPTGLGAKGNEGVSGMVRQMEGSIGYVELTYALQNNMPFGSVQNSEGQFVKATVAGATAASSSIKQMPPDFRVSITNAPGKASYPISSFVWTLLPETSKDPSKGHILKDFMTWVITDGQKFTESLSYSPVPETIVVKARALIDQVK